MSGRLRAVFFDFSDTLVYDVPRQEDLLTAAAADFGLSITPQAARRGLYEAGKFWTAAMAARPPGDRSQEEQQALFAEYDRRALAAAGAEVAEALARRVFERLMQRSRTAGHRLALFDDALPGLAALRAAGLAVGIISNLDRSLHALCRQLGLADAVDVIISAADAGASKPDPRIFRAALAAAGVPPEQALHVGDQLHQDVAGAAAAGVGPVLMDRYGVVPDYEGARVAGMAEVLALVQSGLRPPPR